MLAAPDRRNTDLQKARDLSNRSGGILTFDRLDESLVSGRIRIPTAKNKEFPQIKQDVSEVALQLPPRYPFAKPIVSFKTPIWNPNVYSSGQLCYGDWKVMEFLDLFLIRLMKVVALDPSVINPQSPANSQAASWYRSMVRSSPHLFPTLSVDSLIQEQQAPGISWRDIR